MITIEDLFEAVYRTSIEKVIGAYVPLKRKGNYYECLCPFHADKSLGSFIITPRLNIYKCFSCGEGGGAVSFVAKYFNLKSVDAAVKIARDLHLFPAEELDRFSTDEIDKESLKKAHNKVAKKYLVVEEDNIASIDERDKVYRAFLNELSLSKEHHEHLSKVRHLSDEEIKEGLYRSIDRDTFVIDSLFKNNKFHDKDLMGIPGFYKAKNEEGIYEWRHTSSTGILIPLKNEDGKIYGLQVRKDEGDVRYVFFSSSFAKNRAEMISGTSAKSGYDCIYPKKPSSKTLFITEGRFKGQILSDFLGTPVITLQGVGAWKSDLLDVVRKMEKNYFKRDSFHFQRIIIAYDSDILTNDSVFKAGRKLGNFLEDSYNISYLLWNPALGKGIDDLIINQDYKEKKDIAEDIRCVKFENFKKDVM